jgi:NADH-quinone oxidoreductase subunit C
MDATTLLGILQPRVAGAAFEKVPAPDCPTLLVPRDHIVETCRAMRDTPELSFSFLADVTAVDFYPSDPRFEVVYQLVCLGERDFPRPGSTLPADRARLKVRVPGSDARVPTVSDVYPNANWAEREVFDLFGIVFEGHPDLRRILMPDEWEGHPLRKDYPVQVKVPYKSHESLQISEEEFVSNVARHRLMTGTPKRPS